MVSTAYTRVDTRDFSRLKKITDPIVQQGKRDNQEYIENNVDLKAEDIEMICRATLEDVLDEIKEWFKSQYDFDTHDFDHFPTLDELIYHENGWTLTSAITTHLKAYNTWRKKEALINSINIILELEAERLRNTVFDTLNEKTERFAYVTIYGDNCCENDSNICEPHFGTYKVKKHNYDLPPYHWGCHCWALYHDNPNLEIE